MRRGLLLGTFLLGGCFTTRTVDIGAAELTAVAGLAPSAEAQVQSPTGAAWVSGRTRVTFADVTHATSFSVPLSALRPAGPGRVSLPPYDADAALADDGATLHLSHLSLWRTFVLAGGIAVPLAGSLWLAALAKTSPCGLFASCSTGVSTLPNGLPRGQ